MEPGDMVLYESHSVVSVIDVLCDTFALLAHISVIRRRFMGARFD